MYTNPEKLPEIRACNLKKFRQVLNDLTDIYNKFEAGEMEGIWFIRRLHAATLGVTWMTDTDGKRYSIGWVDGKLIKTLEPEPVFRNAYERLRQQQLTGASRLTPPDGVTAHELRNDEIALT